MFFLRHMNLERFSSYKSQLWAICAYVNPLLCSKFLVAKALFGKADLGNREDVQEVVCASIGNLAISIAYFAHLHCVRATMFLPNNVPDRVKELVEFLGAKTVVCEGVKLKSEVEPVARAYANETKGALYLDQFDIVECGRVYTETVFDPLLSMLPFDPAKRPVVVLAPFGTGGLFFAACSFVQKLAGKNHKVVPVGLYVNHEPDKQLFDFVCAQYPSLDILSYQCSDIGQAFGAFDEMSLLLELPFGVVSAVTMAHAVAQMNQDQEVVVLPVLTDSVLSSVFFAQPSTDCCC
ncbi:MAG: pyridoxal-phosphate dependent enzyme [Patescibacteria group bacterium]